MSRTHETAVIIGGSIAGTLSAVALSPYFERVLVLDRDELPSVPRSRKGVPHAHQFHVLTSGGRLAMERLLPGLTDQAVSEGVPLIDVGADIRYASKSGWFPRFRADVPLLLPTRPFLEALLRRRVSEISNVRYRPSAEVVKVLIENGRAYGVEVAAVGGTDVIRADLIIDASGRTSKAPTWLSSAGYEAPKDTVVDAHWGYTTTYLRPPLDWHTDFKSMYIGPTVSGEGVKATRGGSMRVQEGGVWCVTAQGCAADYPPPDLEGMKDYFASIEALEFVDLLERGDVIAAPRAWRNTANRKRGFVDMPDAPGAFVAIGDSVAAFNPIYGQGMAVSAMGAELLGQVVGEQAIPNGFESAFVRAFQSRLDVLVSECWTLSTGADHKVPGVTVDGIRVDAAAPTARGEFLDRVLALATEDQEVARKFIEMRQLVRGPEWLEDQDLRARITRDWDRLGSLTRA